MMGIDLDRVRCIYCDAEVIYYRDSHICCVNPSCKREFTIDEYYADKREKIEQAREEIE